MEIFEHCEEAAKFFDELAVNIKVTPPTHAGLWDTHYPTASLLERSLIYLYKDRAEALRAASSMLSPYVPRPLD